MAFKIATLERAFSLYPETAYGTAQTTSLIAFTNTNPTAVSPHTNTENDASEQGKPSEFIYNKFNVSRDATSEFDKQTDATALIYWLAYAFGTVSEAGSGASGVYTIKPWDIVNVGLQLPSFTVAELGTEAGSSAISNVYPGCVVDDLNWTIQAGPGRSSSKMTVRYTGSGARSSASAVTFPSLTTPHYMLAQSLVLTINGEDYVAANTILDLNFSVNNNLDLAGGYRPGSGVDSANFAERNQLWIGNRTISFGFSAYLLNSSTEYTKLMAGTQGSATFKVQYDSQHYVQVALGTVAFTNVEYGSTNGDTTVKVSCDVIQGNPADLGSLVTITGSCGTDGICIPV
jgi:hypothetical protein